MARPKTHATPADRLAAYRSRHARIDVALSKDLGETLESISLKLSVSKNELIESMIRFALTNHDWARRGGVWGRK